MTPRKRTVRVDDTDDVEMAQLPMSSVVVDPPKSPLEERQEAELQTLMDSVGSDGRVTVYHVADGKSNFAGQMSMEGFSMESLLDAFGGGDKTLVIYQGTTRKGTIRVSLDPSIPPTSPRLKAQQKAAAVSSPSGQPSTPGLADMSQFLLAMGQSSMRSMEMFQTMMAAMSAQNQQTIQTVISLLGAKKDTDPLDLVTKVLEVTKDRSGPGAGMADMLSMLDRGLNLGKSLNGSDEDGTTTMVTKGLETLNVAIQAMVANRGATHVQGQRALPPGSPVQTIDASPEPEPDTQPEGTKGRPPIALSVRPWVDAARPFMVQAVHASAFVKPPLAASMIDDALTDDQFEDLMIDLEQPNFPQRLVAYFPEEMQRINPEWLGAVIEELLKQDDGVNGSDSSSGAVSRPGDPDPPAV